MHRGQLKHLIAAGAVAAVGLVSACGGGGGNDSAAFAALAVAGSGSGSSSGSGATGAAPAAGAAVRIVVTGPNAVTTWSEVAINTINVPAATSGTASEQRPSDSVDLATVHLAIYDALVAIAGRYQPYAIVPAVRDVTPASEPAAIAAAAYGVLGALFPNRAAQYQPAYDSALAAIADGDAKTRGLALGAEVARGIVALRANDGRSVALAPYVPGTTPGKFRGVNPINRYVPFIKPFSITSAAQFRTPPTLALDSAGYAADFNETRTLGGTVSSLRTDAQLEIARFHTEPPFRFWPRNLRRFAMTAGPLVDQARLLAMLFTAESDATIACFESKYFYEFWRPQSAIPLADTDGNAATVADPAWTPVLPTPNHPEYPAAHGCVASAVTETLKAYYGTGSIEFVFDSTVTGSTHAFTSTDAFVQEVRGARIYGGMHFRNSIVRGEELGGGVGRWVAQHGFQPR